jgi:hypothetical protein
MTSIGPCQTCSLLTVFGARPHSVGQSHRLKQRVPQAIGYRHVAASDPRLAWRRSRLGRAPVRPTCCVVPVVGFAARAGNGNGLGFNGWARRNQAIHDDL